MTTACLPPPPPSFSVPPSRLSPPLFTFLDQSYQELSPQSLWGLAPSPPLTSLLSLLTAKGLGLGWAAGTHIVLDWHFVLLKDGKLLVNGRDLGFYGGQFVLQGLHELQTDPQFLQGLGRAADSAGRGRERGWAVRAAGSP